MKEVETNFAEQNEQLLHYENKLSPQLLDITVPTARLQNKRR